MSARRRVRLFECGQPQAVHIPREFGVPGDEVPQSKEGERLLIEPASPRSLLAVVDGLEPLGEAFPPIEELPLDSVGL
jgi:antitoxin VapB